MLILQMWQTQRAVTKEFMGQVLVILGQPPFFLGQWGAESPAQAHCMPRNLWGKLELFLWIFMTPSVGNLISGNGGLAPDFFDFLGLWWEQQHWELEWEQQCWEQQWLVGQQTQHDSSWKASIQGSWP